MILGLKFMWSCGPFQKRRHLRPWPDIWDVSVTPVTIPEAMIKCPPAQARTCTEISQIPSTFAVASNKGSVGTFEAQSYQPGSFYELGVQVLGVLVAKALPFGVFSKAPPHLLETTLPLRGLLEVSATMAMPRI